MAEGLRSQTVLKDTAIREVEDVMNCKLQGITETMSKMDEKLDGKIAEMFEAIRLFTAGGVGAASSSDRNTPSPSQILQPPPTGNFNFCRIQHPYPYPYSYPCNLGSVKENVANGDLECVMNRECEAGGGVIDECKSLEDVKNEEKIRVEISGSLSIEANLRKVSLDESRPVDVSVAADNAMDVKAKALEKFDEAESDSERSSSRDSLSEATLSSDDDDDDDEVVKRKAELVSQLEESEILDEDVEQMIAWSDDDEVEVAQGPVRSKNEIQDLPHVPPIKVTLNPSHQTFPVGVILSIVGKQVIVEGVEKHNPLNEGSILWITERRDPLGFVDDIFGPVKNPYYSIRYNDEDDVPSGITIGTSNSFVQEFVNHVLNDTNLLTRRKLDIRVMQSAKP